MNPLSAIQGYIAIGMGVVIILLGAGMAVQTSRLSAVKTEYKAFVDITEATGKRQEALHKSHEAQDKLDKEKSDHDYAEAIAKRDATISRLRSQRPSGSFVPSASPTSRNPETACFTRTELERALREFDTEVSGIVKEGDDSRIGLDSAKNWIKSINDN